MFYFSLYCKFNVIQGANKVVVVEKFSYAKKWLEETSPGPLSTGIVLLISNHRVFLACDFEFFKKLKLYSPKRLVLFQLFEKLTLVQINSKLNSKPA